MTGDTVHRVVADTHVHLYPFYDLGEAVGGLCRRLGSFDGDSLRAGFLTERSDCRYLSDVREGKVASPVAGHEFRPGGEEGVVTLAEGEEVKLYLLAGSQIITGEGIEILALMCDARIRDGLAADDAVAAVREAGGMPVLSWAPGKWLCERGKVVRRLLERSSPGELLVGDTAMRPTLTPEPPLMRRARREGYSVVAGSDALPFPGEEKYLGTYASRFAGPFDPDRPLASFRRLLADPGYFKGEVGERCGIGESMRRFALNWRAKKAGSGSPLHGP
jgi:hypothetical protein